MPFNPDSRVRQVLADVLQEALSKGRAVTIPGFGTLRVEHRSAAIERDPGGEFSLHPPRRSVVFDPDPH